MDKLKEILTDIKTVIGLLTTIIALITWVIVQSNNITSLEKELVHTKELHQKDVESLDKAIGWNKLYIVNQLSTKPVTAGTTR